MNMRDAVEEALRAELNRRDAYENQVPTCDICRQKMTNNEYFFDVDGTKVCDSYDCICKFLGQFRRSVEGYVYERSCDV